jgi:3-hydroxyacyl-CoA dehydrogenase/enoyl-CoA hydratase/3-hydroxybutyryl-CoA epimerase
VLTSGKTSGFCAGADLGDVGAGLFSGSGDQSEETLRSTYEGVFSLSRTMRSLETCGKPIAAAINGLALGGGFELTLACHYRVISDDPKSQVGLPEVKVGLLPGSGGTQRVPRLVGAQAALMMITEGKSLKPAEAKGMGLVHEVVRPDKSVEAAKTWVREKGDPVAPGTRRSSGSRRPALLRPGLADLHHGQRHAEEAVLRQLSGGAEHHEVRL